MECRLCGHPKSHKHGKMPNEHQRYFCPHCQQTFCESFDTLSYWRRVSPEQVQQCYKLIVREAAYEGLAEL